MCLPDAALACELHAFSQLTQRRAKKLLKRIRKKTQRFPSPSGSKNIATAGCANRIIFVKASKPFHASGGRSFAAAEARTQKLSLVESVRSTSALKGITAPPLVERI
jgi:hypothetical protein